MTYIKTVHESDPISAAEYNKMVGMANEVFYDYSPKGGPSLRFENDEVWFMNNGADLTEPGDIVEITGFVNSRNAMMEMKATISDGFLLQGHRPESMNNNFSQAIGFSMVTIKPGDVGKILLRGVTGAMVTCEEGETVTMGKYAKIKNLKNRPVYDKDKGEYFIAAASQTIFDGVVYKAWCALVPRYRKPAPMVKNVQIAKYAVDETGYDTAAEVQAAKDAIDAQIAALNQIIATHRLPIQICVFSDWSKYLINVECAENGNITGIFRWEKQILIKEFRWVSDHDRPEDEDGLEELPNQECEIEIEPPPDSI